MNISESVEIQLECENEKCMDILRCLNVLYGSRIGSLALDREFGIDWSFVDMPIETAKAMLEAELIKKTRKYESRAKIKKVIWNGDAVNGLLIPKVVIDIV